MAVSTAEHPNWIKYYIILHPLREQIYAKYITHEQGSERVF